TKATFMEGDAAIVVTGTDVAGNTSAPWMPALTLHIDYTPPVITITNAPQQVPQNAALTFTVHPNEPLSGAPSFVTTPDAGVWLNGPFGCVPAGDDYTCAATVIGSAPLGFATFQALGSDVAGNAGQSLAQSVEVISAVSPIALSNPTVTPPFARGGQSVTV